MPLPIIALNLVHLIWSMLKGILLRIWCYQQANFISIGYGGNVILIGVYSRQVTRAALLKKMFGTHMYLVCPAHSILRNYKCRELLTWDTHQHTSANMLQSLRWIKMIDVYQWNSALLLQDRCDNWGILCVTILNQKLQGATKKFDI